MNTVIEEDIEAPTMKATEAYLGCVSIMNNLHLIANHLREMEQGSKEDKAKLTEEASVMCGNATLMIDKVGNYIMKTVTKDNI